MPEMTSTQRQMLALCSLVSAGDRCDWGVLARQAHQERSLDGLVAGDILETSANAHRTGWVIKTASAESWTAAWERADSEYRAATAAGARLTTVLDDDFPLNLRLIHNLPPFLFYRGGLDADRDAHSVAVVGTRSATPDGIHQARRVVPLANGQGPHRYLGAGDRHRRRRSPRDPRGPWTHHRRAALGDHPRSPSCQSGPRRGHRGLGRAHRVAVLPHSHASQVDLRQAQRSHLRHQPRHRRDRSTTHVGSPNAGPTRV